MLHQSLLEGLAPTSDRCMSVLLARCWILHDHLFVNRHVKENSTISTRCLFQSGIDPTVHVVARIQRTIERCANHCGEDFPILFVNEPRSHVGWKRGWIEKHAQPCCRWCCWSRHCDRRCRCGPDSSVNCMCNCRHNISQRGWCWTRSRIRCDSGRSSRNCQSCWSNKTSCSWGSNRCRICCVFVSSNTNRVPARKCAESFCRRTLSIWLLPVNPMLLITNVKLEKE